MTTSEKVRVAFRVYDAAIIDGGGVKGSWEAAEQAVIDAVRAEVKAEYVKALGEEAEALVLPSQRIVWEAAIEHLEALK